MSNITHNLLQVRSKISDIAIRFGRTSEEVFLLAVSKSKPVSAIAEAITAGHYAFGESYVLEGTNKICFFRKRGDTNLQWHFIGSIQSNKSHLIAKYFDWCQTVDSLRIARRLNDQRPSDLPQLNVLIQINISKENSKSGIDLGELCLLAAEIVVLPKLILRGLMAIPFPESSYKKQFSTAKKMSMAFNMLKSCYSTVDTLSLGMSDDIESAIAAGSTMVRIGRAIFGARDYIKNEGT